MKTIYFVRHAKSSWEDPSLADHERPLNPRGLRDAPFMAKLLKGKGVKPDLIISSPAVRAFTTASYFAEALGIEVEDILKEETVYEAYSEDVIDVLKEVGDEVKCVLIFGHNPTFTSLANRFSEDYIANVPTCGIFKVDLDIKKWSKLDEGPVISTDYYYPKQYF